MNKECEIVNSQLGPADRQRFMVTGRRDDGSFTQGFYYSNGERGYIITPADVLNKRSLKAIGNIDAYEVDADSVQAAAIAVSNIYTDAQGDHADCPTCHRRILTYEVGRHDEYCPKCGQRLDWQDPQPISEPDDEPEPFAQKACKCGSKRFYAHQVSYHDVIVTADNEFDSDSGIYESGYPYGPYVCKECGAECAELDDLLKTAPPGGAYTERRFPPERSKL